MFNPPKKDISYSQSSRFSADSETILRVDSVGKFYSILMIESSESAESLESSEATHVVASTTQFQSIPILCGLVASKFPVGIRFRIGSRIRLEVTRRIEL